MNVLITSSTGFFPIATSYAAVPSTSYETELDIKIAKRTEQLYRHRGRSAFKPLTDYGKGQSK